jgi:hypothetical protein
MCTMEHVHRVYAHYVRIWHIHIAPTDSVEVHDA